jgi:uncharacterized protein DUF4136
MMKNCRTLGVTGVLVVAAVVSLAAVKVRVERDPAFDFTKLSTWTWNPEGPGLVKIWLYAESKSEPVQKQYEPVIMKAVEDHFAKRGYVTGANYKPDFRVTYYVLITQGSSSQYMGQFLPTNAQWGIPIVSPATSSLTFYPQGTMILDVTSLATGNIVWRGIAEAKIESERTDAQREQRVHEIVGDLLAKFPKKKK